MEVTDHNSISFQLRFLKLFYKSTESMKSSLREGDYVILLLLNSIDFNVVSI